MKKAKESGDTKKTTEINAIIRREVVIRNWRITNHVLKPRGPQTFHVEKVTCFRSPGRKSLPTSLAIFGSRTASSRMLLCYENFIYHQT